MNRITGSVTMARSEGTLAIKESNIRRELILQSILIAVV
jgi:hypothetical protein